MVKRSRTNTCTDYLPCHKIAVTLSYIWHARSMIRNSDGKLDAQMTEIILRLSCMLLFYYATLMYVTILLFNHLMLKLVCIFGFDHTFIHYRLFQRNGCLTKKCKCRIGSSMSNCDNWTKYRIALNYIAQRSMLLRWASIAHACLQKMYPIWMRCWTTCICCDNLQTSSYDTQRFFI